MASAVIHICVAKEVNKCLKTDEKQLFLGTIAPDISKEIGESRTLSHFFEQGSSIPNLESFLKKYHTQLKDPFVMGYYIHLYTDYLWGKYFLSEICHHQTMIRLDGKLVPYDEKKFCKWVYQDYTNLNIKLIDEYELDLSLFYEPVIEPRGIITEIPMDKLQIIVDRMGVIIENSKEQKSYLFEENQIEQFIQFSSEIIVGELKQHYPYLFV